MKHDYTSVQNIYIICGKTDMRKGIDGLATLIFSDSGQTEEQSMETISYTVIRKVSKKKRNDSFRHGVEIEEIHHHPANTQCDCCLQQMTEAGTTVAREEAKFIPAKMVRIHHIEHAYECKVCKKDATHKAQIIYRSDGKKGDANAYNWGIQKCVLPRSHNCPFSKCLIARSSGPRRFHKGL